jgi:VIT1/CCC1 family predicted Fe2+/Mn2+ transporter
MRSRIVAYKRSFVVSDQFTLSHFIKVLDTEDFSPFVLLIETINSNECRLRFEHIRYPLGVSHRKGNIGDEILLSECIIKWFKPSREILIEASMGIGGLMVIGTFVTILLILAVFTGSWFALILSLAVLGAVATKFSFDKQRYINVGQIAMHLSMDSETIST